MSILNAQSAASAMFGGNYLEAADALKKALEANAGGTDFSQFSGGAALGMESLDGIMKATLQDNQHFVAFNKLRSSNATNIIDQYVTQTAVGVFRAAVPLASWRRSEMPRASISAKSARLS